MAWFRRRAEAPADGAPAEEWLDAVVAAARAHRGMVIVAGPGGLRVHAARSDCRRDLTPPFLYSPTLCRQVLASGVGAYRVDLEGGMGGRSFIPGGHWEVVATQCHPLTCGSRLVGVLHLESREDVRLDEVARNDLRAAVAGLAAAVRRATDTV